MSASRTTENFGPPDGSSGVYGPAEPSNSSQNPYTSQMPRHHLPPIDQPSCPSIQLRPLRDTITVGHDPHRLNASAPPPDLLYVNQGYDDAPPPAYDSVYPGSYPSYPTSQSVTETPTETYRAQEKLPTPIQVSSVAGTAKSSVVEPARVTGGDIDPVSAKVPKPRHPSSSVPPARLPRQTLPSITSSPTQPKTEAPVSQQPAPSAPKTTQSPPDLQELPKAAKQLLFIGFFLSVGLIIIGGLGFKYSMFGFRVSVGIWAGILSLLTHTVFTDPRNRAPKYTQRCTYGFFNFLTFIGTVVFIGWHGRGLTIDLQLKKNCTFYLTESYPLRNCSIDETYGLDDFIFYPLNEAETTARIALQASGIAISVFLILIGFLRWEKTKHLPGHVKPAPNPNRLPPLPKSVTDGMWMQIFVSIGLIIIGALGFKYRIFGFKISVGIWAGLLGFISTISCNDPRPQPPKYNQRKSFIFFNFLAFSGAVVFMGWHGQGLSVDNQFNEKCVFNRTKWVTAVNCTDYNTYGLDQFVFLPKSSAEITARVALQAVGIFFSALTVVFICGRWEKTKQLPGKVAPQK
ncbi:uncharacterized protein LOC135496792 [Lineus longissimus]|uniref:uncharacterized protein LOC135496792 n=1 Tax=Lineus longissimus TaxID=88925 RepID=UPI00315DCF21